MLQASKSEFRNRFWLFGFFYWFAFSVGYFLDRKNTGVAIVSLLVRLHLRPAVTDGDIRLVFCVGALLALMAAALRTWATGYLKSAVMVDSKLHTATLVASGPYRFVRNPLYLGNVLLALGYAALTSRAGAVILVFGTVWFCLRLIGREEQALAAEQGAEYVKFCGCVPRLLPALTPRLPAASDHFSLVDGLLGEMFFWCMAAALVVFAATLKLPWFFITLALSFAVYFVCYQLIRRRNSVASTQA